MDGTAFDVSNLHAWMEPPRRAEACSDPQGRLVSPRDQKRKGGKCGDRQQNGRGRREAQPLTTPWQEDGRYRPRCVSSAAFGAVSWWTHEVQITGAHDNVNA